MIKIININRKVRSEEAQTGGPPLPLLALKVTGANCNVVIATDEHYNRGHFTLTDEESAQFDKLAQQIERRIVRDIGDPFTGLEAAVDPSSTKTPKEVTDFAQAATAGVNA